MVFCWPKIPRPNGIYPLCWCDGKIDVRRFQVLLLNGKGKWNVHFFMPAKIVQLVICRCGARQKTGQPNKSYWLEQKFFRKHFKTRKRLNRWTPDPIHSATTRQVFQFTQTHDLWWQILWMVSNRTMHDDSHRRLACVCVHHLRIPVADFKTPFPDRPHRICPLSFSIRESATSSYVRNAFAHPSIQSRRPTNNAHLPEH